MMTSRLRHRGPDDFGAWVDDAVGIALGHARLSIIDLTDAGHQPMKSECGRYTLIFNGEIYNHNELRQELGGRNWRGTSDTETLLASIQEHGLEKTLTRSVGMFALALWDSERRMLSLARDRLGEKPLYYGWHGKTFLFASESKALHEHPDFSATVDRMALSKYVRHGYIPAPLSIYSGVQKVHPGSIIEIASNHAPGVAPRQVFYWDAAQTAVNGYENPLRVAPHAVLEELESLLLSSVRGQMLSDVPLGAFLSGGVDSSTVVAVMQSLSSIPIKTFTIASEVPEYNEGPHALGVANHLGTEHTELLVSAKDALDVVPDIAVVYDEPFADASQIPTLLVSRLARQYVKVALSGDGGDELFGGYGHYPNVERQWQKLAAVPLAIRRAMRTVLPCGPLRDGIASKDVDEFYQFTNRQWKGFPNIIAGEDCGDPSPRPPQVLRDAKERMMYNDMMQYLPDDILVKVDRAAMSASLESRAPLLDHRIVEFAWRLPIGMKIRNGVGKWPLKKVLQKYVPPSLVDRPKMGFGVPIEHWLRGPLKGWAEDLLAEKRLQADGFFNPGPIRSEWALHQSGRKNRHYGLWTILMFQAWHDAQKKH